MRCQRRYLSILLVGENPRNTCTNHDKKAEGNHQNEVTTQKRISVVNSPWKHSLASPDISTTSPLLKNIAIGRTSLDFPPRRKMALHPRLNMVEQQKMTMMTTRTRIVTMKSMKMMKTMTMSMKMRMTMMTIMTV